MYDALKVADLRVRRARADLEHAEKELARLEAEEERAVRVVFDPRSTEYVFRMPKTVGPMPQIGQQLTVPPTVYHSGHRSGSQVVTVVGFGRQGYKGELRDIEGWVVPIEPERTQ